MLNDGKAEKSGKKKQGLFFRKKTVLQLPEITVDSEMPDRFSAMTTTERDITLKKFEKLAEEVTAERIATRRSVFKKVFISFVAIIVVFGIVGAVAVSKMLNFHFIGREEYIDRSMEDFVTDEYDKEYAKEKSIPVLKPNDVRLELVEPLHDEDLLNILLIGQDKRPGEDRARSDAMIVCSVNPDTGEVALISFLRDLYVTIPDYSDNRLNAAYAFGGFDLIKKTLYANFGITIDGCFEADFDEFITIIDLLDGLDIKLTAEEAKAVGVGSKAAQYHLDGKHALKYARIRKLGTDFGRTERQRKVILATLDKARAMDIDRLIEIVQGAMPYLSTDLTTTQITKLIARFLPLIPKVSLGTYFIPASDCYEDAMINGMAVLIPDLKENHDILRDEYLPF